VHKDREGNRHKYLELTGIGNKCDELLNHLELLFIEFQTCLAIVDMLSKDERALEVDYKRLKKCQKGFDDQIKELNRWFSGGTF
jgi:hypothetical protein